jgi:hypothetical protein
LTTAMGQETFATAWTEGRAMALDQAIVCALADCPPEGTTREPGDA